MGTNISLHKDVLDKIKEYTDARGIDRSAFIRYACEKVFITESPKLDLALDQAIKRWLTPPFNLQSKSLWSIIFLLKRSYPDRSAKDYWTEALYVGPRDVTNEQLANEIQRDYETLRAVQR